METFLGRFFVDGDLDVRVHGAAMPTMRARDYTFQPRITIVRVALHLFFVVFVVVVALATFGFAF